MRILITGCAGFIGFHLANSLLSKKNKVYGIDNLNNYYSVALKKDRLKEIYKNAKNKNLFFQFKKIDISNFQKLNLFFKNKKFDIVVNLAAQAGIRLSVTKTSNYFTSNLLGFYNLIEISKNNKVKHFVYASTSSVYGLTKKKLLKENCSTDSPLQFYAATKKSNELIAHAFSSIFKLPTTGLRFFTVYGPWGRPDMAYFNFTKQIINRKTLKVFNYGNHSRDLTYIDDIINMLKKVIYNNQKKQEKKYNSVPFQIYNLGNSYSLKLKKLIQYLESFLKIKAKKKYLSLQKGDMINTLSDTKKFTSHYKFKISTHPKDGLKKFVNWYQIYFKNK